MESTTLTPDAPASTLAAIALSDEERRAEMQEFFKVMATPADSAITLSPEQRELLYDLEKRGLPFPGPERPGPSPEELYERLAELARQLDQYYCVAHALSLAAPRGLDDLYLTDETDAKKRTRAVNEALRRNGEVAKTIADFLAEASVKVFDLADEIDL